MTTPKEKNQRFLSDGAFTIISPFTLPALVLSLRIVVQLFGCATYLWTFAQVEASYVISRTLAITKQSTCDDVLRWLPANVGHEYPILLQVVDKNYLHFQVASSFENIVPNISLCFLAPIIYTLIIFSGNALIGTVECSIRVFSMLTVMD